MILPQVRAVLEELAAKWGCQIVSLRVEREYVRLHVTFARHVQPSRFINNLKSVSSRRLRKDLVRRRGWRGPVWTRTYLLLTHGSLANEQLVQEYLARGRGE